MREVGPVHPYLSTGSSFGTVQRSVGSLECHMIQASVQEQPVLEYEQLTPGEGQMYQLCELCKAEPGNMVTISQEWQHALWVAANQVSTRIQPLVQSNILTRYADAAYSLRQKPWGWCCKACETWVFNQEQCSGFSGDAQVWPQIREDGFTCPPKHLGLAPGQSNQSQATEAPVSLKGTRTSGAGDPEANPWLIYRKRRSHKRSAPVLSSSLGAKEGSQPTVHTTLVADGAPGDSEEGCDKQTQNHKTQQRMERSHIGRAQSLHPSAASVTSQSLLTSGCCHNSFAEVRSTSCEISGPRFFPSGFSCAETKRKRKKQRSRHPPKGATPEQIMRRQIKARLRLWKRLREVLIHHLFIPEEEEHTLITLAESEGVKDNEDGLEGWTAFQLMNKVSEGANAGFEVLTQAVEDIVSNLSSKEARTIQIRSSNITQWRPEVQKWLQAQSDDILLVQETHLTKEGVTSAVAAMHKAGYEMIGGEAAPSNKKGTYGGVAIFSKTHFKARTVQHFTIEGCGFCAAEVRVKGVSLLLVFCLPQKFHTHSEPPQCGDHGAVCGAGPSPCGTMVGGR